MSRLDILKASLEKKQARFNRKLNEHLFLKGFNKKGRKTMFVIF